MAEDNYVARKYAQAGPLDPYAGHQPAVFTPATRVRWPPYLPPPCPDCETETIRDGTGPIRHVATKPCDAHTEENPR